MAENTKTICAAAVIIPPQEIWRPIQAMRARYDRHFARWMPHITLAFPFRPREEFESLVLDLWLRSHDDRDLEQSFDSLGQSLLSAQEEYLRTKRLDEALFGEEFQ